MWVSILGIGVVCTVYTTIVSSSIYFIYITRLPWPSALNYIQLLPILRTSLILHTLQTVIPYRNRKIIGDNIEIY